MKLTVGTTPVLVGTDDYPDVGATGQTVVVQNLGTGDVYIDFDAAVTTGTGFKLGVGAAYEFASVSGQSLYAVASAIGTDVRILVVG